MTKRAYTVGQVNSYIKNMFAQDFMLHGICIKGEVSNCKYHTSGHIYFTLKDESGAMNAIMFAGNRRGLKFPMQEGDKVLAAGSVEVYERDGRYQLYARTIERDGEGDLYRKFEMLKQELEEMGMFAQEYKKAVPPYAARIGIVTAQTGAAIRDIQNIARRRNPYVQLILCPALVQGEGAAVSIVNGIRALDALGVDVMIVGRGGGSMEDLWAFNEEIVARAIFECNTPVISAVGHETDTTIADFVADLRAPTPSAAAELAIFDYHLFQQQMEEKKYRMMGHIGQKLSDRKNRLSFYQAKLETYGPSYQLNEKKQYCANLEERLCSMIKAKLMKEKYRMGILAGKLDGLSPVKILSQGLSYVTDEKGKRLHDINKVKEGQKLNVRMKDGILKTEVKEIQILKDILEKMEKKG